MSSISCEPNAYYVFDRAYDSFRELYRIHLTESFFVVRAKTNLKYKIVKWKRRMPKNVLTDAEVKLTGYLSEKKYPWECCQTQGIVVESKAYFFSGISKMLVVRFSQASFII